MANDECQISKENNGQEKGELIPKKISRPAEVIQFKIPSQVGRHLAKDKGQQPGYKSAEKVKDKRTSLVLENLSLKS